jgi:rhodanese-related sulfurtransferase
VSKYEGIIELLCYFVKGLDPCAATRLPCREKPPSPEWREPELQDRSRPIITACQAGELGALASKLLKDMGFSNVSILEGGTQAWKDAGFPTR